MKRIAFHIYTYVWKYWLNRPKMMYPVHFRSISRRLRLEQESKKSLVMILKWWMFVFILFFCQEIQILQEISIVPNERAYFESKYAIVDYENSIRICCPEGFGDSRLIFFRLWQNQNFASGYQWLNPVIWFRFRQLNKENNMQNNNGGKFQNSRSIQVKPGKMMRLR